jgi:murein DD-endopeptidase MepM/ murein hydrolase activator NlpD
MKKSISIVLIVIASLLILCIDFNYKASENPNIYYQVYLNGEILGTIKSKSELEKYIDKQNEKYKKEFDVNKIYAPNGLEIKKIETYNSSISSVEEIYNMIAEKEPFTIKGYQFTIKKESLDEQSEEVEDVVIYVLKQSTFTNAVESAMKTFIGEDNYNNYKNSDQEEISTTGSVIENIYIEEDITVKEVYIPVDAQIYTDSADLAKFFVFGSNVEQSKYTVKIGDTISDVAFANEISVEEFLISNPSFSSSNSLLFPGQEVTIGVTNPQISVVVEEYVVKDQEVAYSTELQYDEDKLIGDDEVIQSGENGLERITQRVKYVNGVINYVDPISKEELKPTINEIIKKGDKYIPTVGSTTNWLWPTNSGYTISSDYIYRINPITGSRELHAAIDISGTGYGSPIYAVTNGVVSDASYRYQDGNYVCINHNNGYYTCYAHMSRYIVSKGQTVARGQIIGYVGQTGYATGPHLHFEVWVGGTPWMGGTRINPWRMYK